MQRRVVNAERSSSARASRRATSQPTPGLFDPGAG